MQYVSPNRLFRLAKQRALGAEKNVVKILTEGSMLAVGEVPGDQLHGDECRGMPSDFGS